jgi:hypothetical protein
MPHVTWDNRLNGCYDIVVPDVECAIPSAWNLHTAKQACRDATARFGRPAFAVRVSDGETAFKSYFTSSGKVSGRLVK